MEKNFKKLLNFITGFECDEEKYLFEAIDKFFHKELNTQRVVIFSLPRHKKDDETRSPLQQCRFLWNKKYLEKSYDKDVFANFLTDILNDNSKYDKWGSDKDKTYIYLGKNQWQIFYVYFDTVSDYGDDVLEYASRFIQQTFRRCQRWREVSKYKSLVYIDDVTGLYNQRKMLKDLEYCIKRYEDLQEKFYVFFVDVDHFKQVNDGHGHLVGTQLLTELAKVLKNDLRTTDYVYRYGGDEYVAIVTDVDDEIASRVGERTLKNIKNHVFIVDDMGVEKEFSLSVSIGIAGFPDDASSYREILSLADRMMYEAKSGGRGTVCQARQYFAKNKKEAK